MGFKQVMSGVGALAETVGVTFSKALDDAYQQGFSAGAQSMQEAILTAAQNVDLRGTEILTADKALAKTAITPQPRQPKRTFNGRAQNGTVASEVALIFRNEEGLSIADLHNRIRARGILVSREAVGNHLRRSDTVLYRREGRKWFSLNVGSQET